MSLNVYLNARFVYISLVSNLSVTTIRSLPPPVQLLNRGLMYLYLLLLSCKHVFAIYYKKMYLNLNLVWMNSKPDWHSEKSTWRRQEGISARTQMISMVSELSLYSRIHTKTDLNTCFASGHQLQTLSAGLCLMRVETMVPMFVAMLTSLISKLDSLYNSASPYGMVTVCPTDTDSVDTP